MRKTVKIRIGSLESAKKMQKEAREIIETLSNLPEESMTEKQLLKLRRAGRRYAETVRYIKSHKKGKTR